MICRTIVSSLLLVCGLGLIACNSATPPASSAPVAAPAAVSAAVPAVAAPPAGQPVPVVAAAPEVPPAASGEPRQLSDFSKPLAYAFLSWQGKAKISDGRLILHELPTKGGGGGALALDLSTLADRSPVLRVRVGAANTAKTLGFRLSDRGETLATWTYELPAPGAEAVTLLPTDAAPLNEPNKRENKRIAASEPLPPLDLAHVTGWQFIGDWQPGVLDVEIEPMLTVPADAAMVERRKIGAKAAADAAAERIRSAAEEVAKAERERKDLLNRYGKSNAGSPTVVATDVIALTIEAQRIVPPVFGPYESRLGDEVKPEKLGPNRDFPMAKLWRGGKAIGWLQGRKLDNFASFESIAGDPLLTFLADDAANYAITSSDDPAYASAQHPAAVFRKSMPTDWLMGDNRFPARHHLYLKLAQPLHPGATYTVSTTVVNLREPSANLVYDPRALRSEAVHANQIGFSPADPCKQAFLSEWLGSGGAVAYPAGLKFSVIDEATGTDAFAGQVELALAADGNENLGGKQVPNASHTAVYRLDFSALRTPGRYRVCVDGIGCSYPFSIAADAWQKAFLVQMRGLFNNRGGIELGPPYTNFRKPRDFHPADGTKVTRTTYDVLVGGDLTYKEFPKGDTGEAVPEAWGGYHDAGDWNPRRVSHMATTLAQLELVELYPAYFNALKLNIPPEEGVPDILTEARFEVDCFRRLQRADGGMPYGLESDGDPMPGEISWLSGQHVYVAAANIRDSWFYATVAGRLAKVLKPFKPVEAEAYLQSARRAFAWAETDYIACKADGRLKTYKDMWRAVDNRNLAALVLYDLTGEHAFHDVFMQETRLKAPGQELCTWGVAIQTDAAFLYARLPDALADAAVKRNALAAVLEIAKRSSEYAAGNAFNLTHREKFRPLFCGFFSTAGGTDQARAHYLTGKPEYLAAALRSTQFQSGCNPNNLVYTSGLGLNPVVHPLHVDARQTGQAAPEGLTVFGNLDYWNWKGGFWDWPLKFINKPDTMWPDAYSWPLTEAFFDINTFVSQNEFVIDTWAPNVFVWGYLAAQGHNEAH